MKKLLVVAFFMFASWMFASAEKTTVTVMLKYDPNTVKWIKEVKKSYEQKYSDRHVELSMFSGTEADFYTKSSLILRSSDKIDVVFEDGFMLKSDTNAGLFDSIPVDKWSEWKNFYQKLKDFATYGDKTYGVPVSTDTLGIFYNISIFKKAGINVPWHPKNWNDILDAARKIKEKNPDVSPITFPVAANGEATAMRTLELLLSGTNNTLFENNKWIVKSPGFLDSLKFVDTVYNEKLGPNLATVLNPQFNDILVNNLAPNDKVAMFINGGWTMGDWKARHPKAFENYKFVAMPTQFGQSPGFTTMSGGWLLSINAKSKKKAEAFEFIKFALSKENSLKYSQILNNLTVRQDVADMEGYPEYLKESTSFINFTHFRPASEQYPLVSPFIQKAVEAVAVGQLTPEDAMNQYADSVTNAVGTENVVTIKK